MCDLQELRKLADWTQWQLSAATGIERTRLSLIENRHAVPTVEEQVAIKKVLVEAIARRAEQFSGVLKEVSA